MGKVLNSEEKKTRSQTHKQKVAQPMHNHVVLLPHDDSTCNSTYTLSVPHFFM